MRIGRSAVTGIDDLEAQGVQYTSRSLYAFAEVVGTEGPTGRILVVEVRRACAGLTGEQLALASVPPSNLSMLGIVRHMADVERAWFCIRFRGEPVPRLYDYEDAAFEHADPAGAEADFAAFTEERDLARRAVTRASLDDEFTGGRDRTWSLRWVYTHMIEEYARHNGHADLCGSASTGRQPLTHGAGSSSDRTERPGVPG